MAGEKVKIGDTIKFGDYDWQVLDIDENKALIMTKDIVAKYMYGCVDNRTWENCHVRQYLNNEFLSKFSSKDQSRIIENQTRNTSNAEIRNPSKAENYVTDKIFLINIDECEKYFGFTRTGRCLDMIGQQWWIRGNDKYYAALAAPNGMIMGVSSPDVFRDDGLSYGSGVRPALWLDLLV